MYDNKSIANNSSENKLELGRYLESDMVALTDDEVVGGGTPLVVVTIIGGFISTETCPTKVCTRAC